MLLPPWSTPKPRFGPAPVPDRPRVCGLPAALSMIESVPVRFPTRVGEKETEIRQLPPAPSRRTQSLDSKKSPVVATLEIDRFAPPVSVRVTTCVVLDVPTTWDTNVKEVGARLTCGTNPLPIGLITCGLPGAVSVMVMLPLPLP